MNFRGRAPEEPEINLIPFIDVLLVILIFLMLSTTYSKFTELQVALPVASAAQRGQCTNLTLSWTFNDNVDRKALGSDLQGDYTGTGFICNGGFDATLNTDASSRAVRHISGDMNTGQCKNGMPRASRPSARRRVPFAEVVVWSITSWRESAAPE